MQVGITLFVSSLFYLLGRSRALECKIEICPREYTKEGKPSGYSCRGDTAVYGDHDTTCRQTHYWIDVRAEELWWSNKV